MQSFFCDMKRGRPTFAILSSSISFFSWQFVMEVNYVACVKRNTFVDSAVLLHHSDKPGGCTNFALIKGKPDSMVCPLPLLNILKRSCLFIVTNIPVGLSVQFPNMIKRRTTARRVFEKSKSQKIQHYIPNWSVDIMRRQKHKNGF